MSILTRRDSCSFGSRLNYEFETHREDTIDRLRSKSAPFKAEWMRVKREGTGFALESYQDEIEREVRRMLASCKSRGLTFSQLLRRKTTNLKSDLSTHVVAMLWHAANLIEGK
jgi:hypothetical protein